MGLDDDEKKLRRVFNGELDTLPPAPSKVVRIFTSSTFTDTTIERNALMEDVYPKIKEYCREHHGLDFQVVDMRWGVRDEATDDHQTTALCMNEIGNCQRLSLGPNFVVFLCQKYGYRPLPTTVLSSELARFKAKLKELKEDVSSLETWYREDANAVPPIAVLQPISSILTNFNNKRMGKLQEQDAAAWWDVMGKMQLLCRKAAKALYDEGELTHDEMHNYFMSVTEREVINGVLGARNTKDHCLMYARQINDINLANLRAASKFVDIAAGKVDAEATKLLSNLRDERAPSKLDAGNIARFTINWSGRDGIDATSHTSYIANFCAHFYQRLTGLVDRAMKKQANLLRNLDFGEILQQLHTCQTVSSLFFGRDAELRRLRDYVQSQDRRPLIIYGEPGCGKTSVLGKAGSCVRGWLADADPILVIRFLGTTPDSSSLSPLLRSLCAQMRWNLGFPEGEEEMPSELNRLFAHLKRQMGRATAERPLVLCLDSLDLLSKVDGAHELLWFPPNLPPHVKVIVSTTPHIATVYDRLRKIVEEEDNFVEIKALGPGLAELIIMEWLKAMDRTLSPRQHELVRRVLAKSSLPIFVKLVFATVSRWKSYSRAQETLLAGSVGESIGALLERVEAAHGKLLVSHALSYITASRAGVSESELEDLISLDDKVLDDVYQYHLPPVRRIPPLLWTRIRADLPSYLSERDSDGVIVIGWYHRQFQVAANERYFKNLNHYRFTHSSMADYLVGVWGGGVGKPFTYTEVQRQRFGIVEKEGLADRKVPLQPNSFEAGEARGNLRKLNQLPFHLLRAQRLPELYSLCLFNLAFLQAKLRCCPLPALLADFDDAYQLVSDADAKRELLLVADALRLSASVLRKDPAMLPCELVGRLLPLMNSHERVRGLLAQSHLEGAATSVLLPLHHSFHAPGGPLKLSMGEHPFAVFGMELSSDGKMLVTVSNQLMMWDTGSGEVARVVRPDLDGVFLGLALSPKDAYAAAYTNANTLVLFSLITGEFRVTQPLGLAVEAEMSVRGVGLSDNELVLWTKTGWLVYGLETFQLVAQRNLPGDVQLLFIDYASPETFFWVQWSGNADDAQLHLLGLRESDPVSRLDFDAALIFADKGRLVYACPSGAPTSVARFIAAPGGWALDPSFPTLITGSSEEILWLGLDESESELVAMHSYGFHLIPVGGGAIREVLALHYRLITMHP